MLKPTAKKLSNLQEMRFLIGSAGDWIGYSRPETLPFFSGIESPAASRLCLGYDQRCVLPSHH